MEQKDFDDKLSIEIVARFTGNSGRQNSIKKLRQEAFVDGALWAKKSLEADALPKNGFSDQQSPLAWTGNHLSPEKWEPPVSGEERKHITGCDHKRENGLSSWNTLSHMSSNFPAPNLEETIAVCYQCGEIRVSGRNKDGHYFSVEFDIHLPDAVEAIVKYCNYINEESLSYNPFIRQYATPPASPAKAEQTAAEYYEKTHGVAEDWAIAPAMTESTFRHQIELAFQAGQLSLSSSPKAEQEGPWKYEVHHDQGPEDCDEWVTISDGKVTLRFNQQEDEEGEQKVVDLFNKLKARIFYDRSAEHVAAYYKEQLDELRKRQQEGLRWVKGCPPERKIYHAKYRFLKEDTEIKEGLITPLQDTRFWEAISINCRNIIEVVQIVAYLDESTPATQPDPVAFAEWVGATYQSNGDGSWYDNSGNPWTTQELYALFLQQGK